MCIYGCGKTAWNVDFRTMNVHGSPIIITQALNILINRAFWRMTFLEGVYRPYLVTGNEVPPQNSPMKIHSGKWMSTITHCSNAVTRERSGKLLECWLRNSRPKFVSFSKIGPGNLIMNRCSRLLDCWKAEEFVRIHSNSSAFQRVLGRRDSRFRPTICTVRIMRASSERTLMTI